jgi:hypothetical protein
LTRTTDEPILTAIKVLHTAVWALAMAAIVYILYASIFHIEGPLLTLAVVLVGAEVIVLLVNGWVCPLTRLARRYSDDPDPAFDIYMPRWMVRHHRFILGILFVLGLVLNLIGNVQFRGF